MTRRQFLSACAASFITASALAKAPLRSKTGDEGPVAKPRRRRKRRGPSSHKLRKAVAGVVMLVILVVGITFKRRRDRERYAALND